MGQASSQTRKRLGRNQADVKMAQFKAIMNQDHISGFKENNETLTEEISMNVTRKCD